MRRPEANKVEPGVRNPDMMPITAMTSLRAVRMGNFNLI
jgi:hypothetical protein